jgi:excisionase family DNA binding protein
MTSIANSALSAPPPFTVDTLAKRWACSSGAVRNRIRAGEIRTFKIGALVRIPFAEVERVECLNTLSSDFGAGSPSSTMTGTETAAAKSLPRPIGLARTQKRGSAGG